MPKIFISAGEASGDALGASLMHELKRSRPDLEFFGMGGPLMAAEGFRAIADANQVAVVGLFEVIRHLPRLFRLKDKLAVAAVSEKPEAAVLIDVPDFNVRLAEPLKAAGIPVAFYVGPSVWAWRSGRVKKFRDVVSRMLVLFPFETKVWQNAGVDTVCVGHPLVDQIQSVDDTAPPKRQVVLLPGSRRSEIKRHLNTLLDAALELNERNLVDRFVLPVAPSLRASWLRERVGRHPISPCVELLEGGGIARRAAMRGSALALVASGTASLEAALIGVPQIIFYKVSWPTYWLGRLLAKVRHIGLPNIIVGREVAPELLQGDFTSEQLVARAQLVLEDDSARRKAQETTAEIRSKLGDGGAATRAADAVLGLLDA